MSNLRIGAVIKGTVVMVEDNFAYIDINDKSEGLIYLDHFSASKEIKSLKDVLKENQVLDFEISSRTPSGQALLSRLSLEEKEKRDKIIRKIMNRRPFEAEVKRQTEGGFYLEKDDVHLFLPDKYLDLDPKFDGSTIVGTTQKVVFVRTEQDEKGHTNFVVSRKQVQYNEEKKAREAEFASINEGDVLDGTVVRLSDFGAFVKFKQVEGLVHLSEISHYHIKSPSEILKVGDKVTVKVLKKTDTKIQLSIKALEKTPWEKFLENHKVGDSVDAKIVKKSDKWMLCEVERDVVGILNQNDYSWKVNDGFQGSVNEGDTLKLQITYIDKEKERMTLSKKHLEYNPWEDVNLRFGEVVTGSVLRFTNTGAIIQVGSVEGFLPDKEASDTEKPASEVLKVGDIVNAEVLRVDPKKWSLTLSIRTIEEKKNREYVDKYMEENVSSSQSIGDLLGEKGQK